MRDFISLTLRHISAGWRAIAGSTIRLAQKIFAQARRATRALLRLSNYLLYHIWIFELVSTVLLLVLIFQLWNLRLANYFTEKELLSYTAALIPVLALTNAISLLGANTYLARYASFDKINELFSDASRIITDNYERLDSHPRDSKFARAEFYSWLGKQSAVKSVKFTNANEKLFTRRPYWDGVWFYGSATYNKKHRDTLGTFLGFHELLICSIFVLKNVLGMRDQNVALINKHGSGTQGSVWFLENLKTFDNFLRSPLTTASYKEAIGLILMAKRSAHYMFDEFRKHQEELGWEEYRKLRFLASFVEYLIWLNYFQGKFMELRFAVVGSWLEKRGRGIKSTAFESRYAPVIELKDKLFALRETIIPRRAIAEKVIQIRFGSFLPIVLTAMALFGYAVVQPTVLTFGIPEYTKISASLVYSLACAAIAENFIFGLWLLIPWKSSAREASM
jgi:hypothetical protein